jgi:urea transport system ATP-binding protein
VTAPAAGTVAGSSYLQVRDLRVTFDGFVAIDQVDLTVLSGDLRFLIGPNGAGKTTLVDAVTGLASATGTADFNGIELIGRNAQKIVQLGVGRTFQTATVFDQLTVLQNLDIAAGKRRSKISLLSWRSGVSDVITAAAEAANLTGVMNRPAGVLSHGEKQWLEIAMLLVLDSKVMFLDEPVAGMSAEEREETGALLQRIGADRVIVVIEHDMDFVRTFANSVTVMHGGRVLSEGTVAQIQADERVQEVYLGRTVDSAADTADPIADSSSAASEEVD